MQAISRLSPRLRRFDAVQVDPAAVAAWLLPVVVIAYLGLNNGGYGIVERGEIGVAAWWLIMVGTAVGALPAAGGTRAGRLMLVLLAAFAAWTALSLSWTESAERTTIELGRTATYLGVFALALAVQGQGRSRHMLHGAATGVALILGLAVLSRLEPTLFPQRVTGDFLRNIQIERQLAYPLNYSTGLAGLAAVGVPLLLGAAASARTVFGSALAAAALPVATLALWLTGSSLALPAAALGAGAFIALAPERLPKLASLIASAAGGAVLIASVEQRGALDRGLPSSIAQRQGDEVMATLLLVCAGVGLVQVGIALASRYGRHPGWIAVSRSTAAATAAAGVVAILVVGVIAGVPGEVSERWEDFRGRGEETGGSGPVDRQILDPTASARYKFWEAAIDANATSPLLGIGPGTFEFWWTREQTSGGFARDAHSFLIEALAELGIVGFLLIGGFAIAVLAIGSVRSLRAPPQRRAMLATATAGCAAFTLTSAVDWTWELGVLPATYMILAAVCVAGGLEPESRTRRGRRHVRRSPREQVWGFLQRQGWRTGVAALAVLGLLAAAIPTAGAVAIERSKSSGRAGDFEEALAGARTAARLQPYAATPHLQEALALEQLGDDAGAVAAGRQATEKEPTNWRTWLTLSRLEVRNGDAAAALDAYERARLLYPAGVPAPAETAAR